MGQFDGRVVIVTGSSNGIGRAAAVKFAQKGAMVTICGRDEKTLDETKSMVLAVNGGDEKKVFIVRGDICQEEVKKEIVERTVNSFGRLDVLVNNAGGANAVEFEKPELESDLSNFEYILDLNFRSIFRMCQLALPHLAESKGDIVNVGSIVGRPNGASIASPFYSIAKGAQDHLTRNLAIYYIQKGVRVNGVSPGLIATNFFQRQGIPAEVMRKIEEVTASSPSRIPCGRAGTAEEVAEAILFLADRQKSSYIVGHQLVVDGGSSLQMPVVVDGFKIFAEILGGLAPPKA
uniref:Short-chain dehydrogenase reductase SDR domain containing protein n=1 Tax=Haemonchus contortus TaxID=6289 RepID=A0A7I4YR88_HAECO